MNFDSIKQVLPETRSTTPEVAQQIQLIHDARDQVLLSFPDNQTASAVVERYVTQIEDALLKNTPVDPEIVAGNENLLPLQEAVQAVNQQRGFAAEQVEQYLATVEKADAIRLGSSERITALTRYWGGWSSMPEELQQTFSAIQEGIDTGNLPGLDAEQLRQLGSSLTPQMRSEIEVIYANHGRLLTIPAVEQRSVSASEQIERHLPVLAKHNFHLCADTAQAIGNGSEGTVYAVEEEGGKTLALKIKHGPDVSNTAEAVTVVAAIASLSPPYDISPVEVLYEDNKIAVMEYLQEAPDLQALSSYVTNGIIPEDQGVARAVAAFTHQYKSDTPEDSDLSGLADKLAAAVNHLNQAQTTLAGSSGWSSYFGGVDNPLTSKPVNFLVDGVFDAQLSLICIDAR